MEYFDVGSPLTNKYYIGAPRGEIYGLDHSVQRFGSPEIMMNLRPETDIPGLLLAGKRYTTMQYSITQANTVQYNTIKYSTLQIQIIPFYTAIEPKNVIYGTLYISFRS